MRIFLLFEQLYQKLPKHFKIKIEYKTPINTLVQSFMKIGPVNQKLPKGG